MQPIEGGGGDTDDSDGGDDAEGGEALRRLEATEGVMAADGMAAVEDIGEGGSAAEICAASLDASEVAVAAAMLAPAATAPRRWMLDAQVLPPRGAGTGQRPHGKNAFYASAMRPNRPAGTPLT